MTPDTGVQKGLCDPKHVTRYLTSSIFTQGLPFLRFIELHFKEERMLLKEDENRYYIRK